MTGLPNYQEVAERIAADALVEAGCRLGSVEIASILAVTSLADTPGLTLAEAIDTLRRHSPAMFRLPIMCADR